MKLENVEISELKIIQLQKKSLKFRIKFIETFKEK